MKARNKKTDEIVDVNKQYQYEFDGYLYGLNNNKDVYTEDEFNELYEIVEDNDLIFSNGFILSGEMVLDGSVSPKAKLTVHTEDPNHLYGGVEVLNNVPKETWRDRFEIEFVDEDTGLLNISKYDHQRLLNWINKEII